MRMMTMETPNPETYSMRPCPKGWSASAFIPENLNPTREIKDDPASDRLLNASAVIAMDPLITPARYFPANRNTLSAMPTIPQSMP